MLSDSTAKDRIESNSHRHHDRQKLALPHRLHHGRIEFTAEPKLDVVIIQRGKNIEEIPGVESDRHIRSGVLDGNFIETFAALRRLRRNSKRPLRERQLYPAGPFACRHRDRAKGLGKRSSRYADDLLALLWNDLSVRRKLGVDQPNSEGHAPALKERAGPTLRNLELRLAR